MDVYKRDPLRCADATLEVIGFRWKETNWVGVLVDIGGYEDPELVALALVSGNPMGLGASLDIEDRQARLDPSFHRPKQRPLCFRVEVVAD